jgi:hypothetical protein
MSTCPTTPYKEKINPFTKKDGIFSIINICPHLNLENGFALLDESNNYIVLT